MEYSKQMKSFFRKLRKYSKTHPARLEYNTYIRFGHGFNCRCPLEVAGKVRKGNFPEGAKKLKLDYSEQDLIVQAADNSFSIHGIHNSKDVYDLRKYMCELLRIKEI